MTDVLVYATESRADAARVVLGAACAATGISTRLEVYGSGSLYQRLGPRHAPPPPDIIIWFGPFAARAAAIDNLLQAYQPSRTAAGVARDPDWKWTALDYSAIAVIGTPQVSTWQDVGAVPRLAIADPERSEIGLSILLVSLDRARQADGDVERGWAWWQERARAGLALTENDAGATSLVQVGSASHTLTLSPGAPPLGGLAPIPHAIGLATSSRNIHPARRVLDWMVSEAAAASLSLSPWQAPTNSLGGLWQGAPPLDVDWARQQYSASRGRWAQSAFAPIG